MAWRDTPELITEHGIVKGWHCVACEAYNDILTRVCKSCQEWPRPRQYDKFESAVIYDRGLVSYMSQANDEQRELHSKFFNKERVFVRDMDNAQLREHRLLLQSIAFEARSRLTAVDAEERERDANGKRDKNWLVSTGNDPLVSDALEVVKERKARMSKADKMSEQLASLGLPAEQVAALMANVAKTQDSSSKSSSTATNLKQTQPTFNKVAGTTNNTKESLLSDISSSLVEGISSGRPVDDLASAAITAGHLANKVLGKSEPETNETPRAGSVDEPRALTAGSADRQNAPDELFDPSKLFN